MGNNVQENYRKQISKSLKKLEQKAKKGEGPLSNNLYRLRFFGNSSTEDPNPNFIIRFFKFIFRVITIIILFIFCSFFFLVVTIATINFLNNYVF